MSPLVLSTIKLEQEEDENGSAKLRFGTRDERTDKEEEEEEAVVGLQMNRVLDANRNCK